MYAAIAFFTTFFLVGLWHGTTKTFILAGLLLGLGASVNQWYRGAARSGLGKRAFDAMSQGVAYGMAAKGLAFAAAIKSERLLNGCSARTPMTYG